MKRRLRRRNVQSGWAEVQGGRGVATGVCLTGAGGRRETIRWYPPRPPRSHGCRSPGRCSSCQAHDSIPTTCKSALPPMDIPRSFTNTEGAARLLSLPPATVPCPHALPHLPFRSPHPLSPPPAAWPPARSAPPPTPAWPRCTPSGAKGGGGPKDEITASSRSLTYTPTNSTAYACSAS